MPGWTAGTKNQTPITQQSDNVQTVQAKIVQHHFVRAQIAEINRPSNQDRMVGKALDQLTLDLGADKKHRKFMDRFKDEDDVVWQAYVRMQKRLQASRLTINFTASGWFSKPNTHSSYSQMYERAMVTVNDPSGNTYKEMRLKDAGSNPAAVRDKADTAATFTKNLMKNDRFEALRRVMDTGGLDPVTGTKEFTSKNPYFNPKSKQVFAAVDYGHRPHGATFYYGMSYLVLDEKYKTNAIYFAADTFLAMQGPKTAGSAMNQVSYGMMGALYGQANMIARKDIYSSCVLKQKLPDQASGSLCTSTLVEAHLFEALTFNGNIAQIYLSPQDTEGSTPATGKAWDEIKKNAKAFADNHGAELYLID